MYGLSGIMLFKFVWDLLVQLSIHEIYHGPGKIRYIH